MINQMTIPSNFSASHDKATVINFLKGRGINVATDKDIVKSFFEGNDFHLAIYDIKLGNNTMLLTIKNFAQNEDLMIQLSSIFRSKTQHLGSYHILKYARQATDDVIGMIPTFRAFFGEKAVTSTYSKVSWKGNSAIRSTQIAA